MDQNGYRATKDAMFVSKDASARTGRLAMVSPTISRTPELLPVSGMNLIAASIVFLLALFCCPGPA
jgi:hypothetical protein